MSTSSFKLSEAFRRVVLINHVSDYGTICAASLALSPFLYQSQKVVMAPYVRYGDGIGDRSATRSSSHSPKAFGVNTQNNTSRKQGFYEATTALDAIEQEVLRSSRNHTIDSDVPYQYYYGQVGPNHNELPTLLQRISLYPDGLLTIHPEQDLLVCVLRGHVLCDSTIHPQPTIEEETLCNLFKATSTAHLLLITDSHPSSVNFVYRLMAIIHSNTSASPTERAPRLVVVRTGDLSPPALNFSLTKCSVLTPSGMLGTIQSVAAGVMLGILSQLPVARHDHVPFIPVDVAINVGLTTFAAINQGMMRPSFSIGATTAGSRDDRIVSIDITRNNVLVWGMVGEYIMDYYGRYAQKISLAFPGDAFLRDSPRIHFSFSPQDIVNWGPEAADCTRYVDQLRAHRRRKRLRETFPSKEMISNFISYLDKAVEKIKKAVKGNAGAKKTFDRNALSLSWRRKSLVKDKIQRDSSNSPLNDTDVSHMLCGDNSPPCGIIQYQDLLMLVRSTRCTAPRCQFISLDEVEWSMYIRCIVRSTLQHIATRWLHAGKPYHLTAQLMQLPKPVHSFVNDFIYLSEAREPPFPSIFRQLLGSVDHSIRAGMCATGRRGPMVRGLNPEILSAILTTPSVQKEISNTAIVESVSEEKITKRAENLLLRMGDTQNHLHCRSIGILVHKFLSTVYCSISYNHGIYERLFRWSKIPRVEIVYIPLHRSYSDFLLLSDMLAVMGLSPPHVVTGEDFLGLGKFAELMRGSGSFFMRRTFKGDRLYTALFSNYIRHLMLRLLPIEFFIEAMRSRTGKTKIPKLGMLKFIIELFFDSRKSIGLDDVLFVPISISYDEVLEAKIFAEELLGIPKPKETLSNMVKALGNFNQRYGKIHVHFGDAISLTHFAQNWSETELLAKTAQVQGVSKPQERPIALKNDSAFSTDPTSCSTPDTKCTPRSELFITLGWYITRQLQKNIVITPAAVVAAGVECTMPICEAEGIGLSLTRLYTTIALVVQGIQQRRGNLSSDFYAPPSCETAHTNNALKSTPSRDPASDIVRVTQLGMNNLGRFLSMRLSNDGSGEVFYHPPTPISHLGVHISTNQLVHIFIDEAVVVVVARSHGVLVSSSCHSGTARAVKTASLRSTGQLLRQLLCKEFPEFSTACTNTSDAWMQDTLARFALGDTKQRHRNPEYLDLGDKAREHRDLTFVPVTPLNDFMLQLIFPYVETLYLVSVAAHVLLETFVEPLPFSKPMVTAIFRAGLTLCEEQNVIKYVTTCNNETVKNCLESLLELPFMRNLSKSALSNSKRSLHTREPLLHTDKEASGLLIELIDQLRALRWIQPPDASEEMQSIKKVLLRCYANACHNARL